MKKNIMLTVSLAITGIMVLSAPAFAQQKTVKACTEEWRANKAANQAAKITEKDYVAKCRAAGMAAPAPAVKPVTAPPAASTAPAPKTSPAAAAPTAKSMAPAPSTTGANQFTTEAQTKARCPSDTIVWVNMSSKIYHFAGHKDYGNTKNGVYMCEKDTAGAGARAAKNEKHP